MLITMVVQGYPLIADNAQQSRVKVPKRGGNTSIGKPGDELVGNLGTQVRGVVGIPGTQEKTNGGA